MKQNGKTCQESAKHQRLLSKDKTWNDQTHKIKIVVKIPHVPKTKAPTTNAKYYNAKVLCCRFQKKKQIQTNTTTIAKIKTKNRNVMDIRAIQRIFSETCQRHCTYTRTVTCIKSYSMPLVVSARKRKKGVMVVKFLVSGHQVDALNPCMLNSSKCASVF